MPCPLIDKCEMLVSKKHYQQFCESQKKYAKCPIYIAQTEKLHRPCFWRATLEALEAQTTKQSG